MSGFFDYPMVREDAERLKIEVSDKLSSPWLPSKLEALRWIRKHLSPVSYDEKFIHDAETQVIDSGCPHVSSPCCMADELSYVALVHTWGHRAARWN